MNRPARDSKDDEPTLLQKIDTSMLTLDAVRRILRGGNLAGLAHAMAVFQAAFEAARQTIEASERSITDGEAGRLRQLETMHHKVMRATATKMQHIQEDIRVIDHARSQLRRTAEMAGASTVNGKL